MSVLKKDRKPSQFDVITCANELRLAITGVLFRDFGLHNKSDVIRRKYKVHLDEDTPHEQYEWLLKNEKDKICKIISDLTNNITAANSIYATNLDECDLRRHYQDIAICNCYQLITELQYIVTIFNVDVNKYCDYSDLIQAEITRLKGWRKSDNKTRNKILNDLEKNKTV